VSERVSCLVWNYSTRQCIAPLIYFGQVCPMNLQCWSVCPSSLSWRQSVFSITFTKRTNETYEY